MPRALIAAVSSLLALLLCACAPVLSRDVMSQGNFSLPFDRMREAPDSYRNTLFILGGVIAETRFTEKGSQIEALYVPVDSSGYLLETARLAGRFIAIMPKANGLLDPLVYRKGREVTMAAVFVETKKGRIDEMEYVYPVFEMREIHLWDEARYIYPAWPYYYSPCYYPPFSYDPWGRPYPNPYWPPPPPR